MYIKTESESVPSLACLNVDISFAFKNPCKSYIFESYCALACVRVRFCMYVLIRRQTLVYVYLISSAEGARAAVVGPICLAAKPLVAK